MFVTTITHWNDTNYPLRCSKFESKTDKRVQQQCPCTDWNIMHTYVAYFLQHDSVLNQVLGEYTSHIKLVFVLWLTYVSAFLPGHLPSGLLWRRWYILCLWPREVSLSGRLQLGWKWWVVFVLFEATQAIYSVKLFFFKSSSLLAQLNAEYAKHEIIIVVFFAYL